MIASLVAAQSDIIRFQQDIIDRLFILLLQYKEVDDFEDEVLAFMSSMAKQAEDIISST